MDKIVLASAGVPGALADPGRVVPIDFDDSGSVDALAKYASERSLHPDIQAWVDGYQPMEGHTAFLIDAMGSDLYGANANADIFPADQLGHDGPDYGFRTFETGAYPFFHHVNRDPKFAYGPMVQKAAWLPESERVQLIAWWNNERSGTLVPRLLDGELLDVSMGCRVKFDVCTVCGKKARNRHEYCVHIQTMRRKLTPEGIRVGMINIRPRFFDISFVRRGAEKCAKFLVPIGVSFNKAAGRTKVATATLPMEEVRAMSSAELAEKVAAATGGPLLATAALPPAKAAGDKQADIVKKVDSNLDGGNCDAAAERVLGAAGRMRRLEHDLPPKMLDSLAGSFPLRQVLASLLAMGVLPKPHEFQRVVLVSMGRKPLADELESKCQCFDPGAPMEPSALEPFKRFLRLGPGDVNPSACQALAPVLEARSAFPAPLARRAVVLVKAADDGVLPLEPAPRRALPLPALAMGLAAFHGALQHEATPGSLNQLSNAAAKNPAVLALMVGLGVAAREAARQVLLTDAQPYGKVAGMGSTMGRFVGLPTASYIYSDLQEAKARRGQRLNRFQEFMRSHPDAASIMAVFGAGPAARAAGKGFSTVGNFLKGASAGGLVPALADNAMAYGIWQRKAIPMALTGAAVDTVILKGLHRLLNPGENQARIAAPQAP